MVQHQPVQREGGESPPDPGKPNTARHRFVGEFVEFLRDNKRWWITPIALITLILISAALLLPSPVAPFIYSLF